MQTYVEGGWEEVMLFALKDTNEKYATLGQKGDEVVTIFYLLLELCYPSLPRKGLKLKIWHEY